VTVPVAGAVPLISWLPKWGNWLKMKALGVDIH
jgi:hypothetical protein